MKRTDFWKELKSYTQARVGLNRTGHAIGTRENLEFQWAHAQARDAIHTPWEVELLKEELSQMNTKGECLSTQVTDRSEYLKRPDLGRLLSNASEAKIKSLKLPRADLLILVSNGLSSRAIHAHAGRFLRILLPELKARSYTFEPLFFIPDARVAIGDHLGEIVKPKLSLTLIGERPGLSSPDSMGLYLTFGPKLGKTDADRNCISNIREPHGLSYEQAVHKTLFLLEEALRRRLSGVQLKDESETVKLLKGAD